MPDHMNDDWSAHFPILREIAFFDHAGVAPICGPAATALREYADQAASRAYVSAGWYARLHEIKQRAADLMGAQSADEISFVANTSTGLNNVAKGLPWREGDNVVITNVEYPANRYPWQDLERYGVKLVEVCQWPDGRVDVDDVCEAINDRTRLVSLSHVQYASGFRIDLAPIARMVHQAGGYLCVDAIQSLGVLPLNVRESGIDFLSADGHKWLLAPEGCGVFYCRHDLIEMLHPALVGWMSMEDHTNYGDYHFEFARCGRRFEPGSYNVPGALALGAAVDLILDVGVDRIWQRVEQLTARLCDGLRAKGYSIFSPRRTASERSGIVVFSQAEGGADMGRESAGRTEGDAVHGPDALVADLRSKGMHIVVREGRLRVSPHFYNREDQIDQLLKALPG